MLWVSFDWLTRCRSFLPEHKNNYLNLQRNKQTLKKYNNSNIRKMETNITTQDVINVARGEVIDDSMIHKFFAVATMLNLAAMEFVEGSKDWSMRLVMDGQSTNFSLSMTRKAASKPFSHWLSQGAVPVLVRHVVNTNYNPGDDDSPKYWVNLVILPATPSKKLLKPLKEALELSEQHARKPRAKATVALAASAQEQ